MDLKTTMQDAQKALRNLDAAIAEVINNYEKRAQSKAEETLEIIEQLKALAEKAAGTVAEKHKAEVLTLSKKIADLQDAEELYGAVYSAESKGVLDTASPLKRLVFEKLAARWDNLTNAELDDLEALLEGKLNFI